MNESYTFELGADVRAARKAIEDLVQETKKGLGSINMNTAVSAIKDGFDLARRALQPVVDLIGQSIDESLAAEAANKRLANAMRIVGDFSEEAMQKNRAFADQLARTTSLTDDQAIEALAVAKAYGLTNKEAQELVKVGADLAALTGDELNPAVEKLAKTYNGFVSRELKQLRPELRSLTEEQLANGEAVRILGERVEGSAAKMSKGFGGAVKEVAKATSELKEALGDYITQSPEMETATRLVADAINLARENMNLFVFSLKSAIFVIPGLAGAVSIFQGMAEALRLVRGETQLTLDGIEKIRLEANKAFSEKQAEERIKRERLANVAAEKAIAEFNGIRADLEKQGLTKVEEINKEAIRRIKIVRDAAAAGQPEAVKRQEEYIAAIRISAARKVAKEQAELDRYVLQNREQMQQTVKNAVDEIANKPLSGLITFAIKGQEELDKVRSKITQQIKEIQASELPAAVKKNLVNTANTMLQELEKGAKQALAVGIASSVLSAVKKGAAGAAEAVAGVVGGIVEAYLPGFGKLAQQLIEFLALGPDEVKRLVTEFEMAVPQVVENILTAIPALIEQIIQNAPKVIQKIIDMIPRVIIAFIKGIPQIINGFIQSIPEVTKAIIKGVPQIITELAKAMPDVAKALVEGIFEMLKGGFGNGIGEAGNFFGGTGGIGGFVGDVIGGISDAVGGIGDFFGGFWAHGGTLPDSPGLRGDRIPIMADAGETILSRDLVNRLSSFLDGGGSSGPTTVILKVGEKELARTILELNRGGYRLQ